MAAAKTSGSDEPHVAVLRNEVLSSLAPSDGDTIADLTVGAGGHAEALLEAASPSGRLIGFDRDPEAIRIAAERLARFGERVRLVEADFRAAAGEVERAGFAPLDVALIDCGVSSMQLDEAERGFSFSKNGPLDMRMSPRIKTTAADILADADSLELERIFREYGEEPRARAIAEKIVELRRRTRLRTTKELAELVRTVVRGGKTHAATRVFQALRIAVNDELVALSETLPKAAALLRAGGRLAVISFHSLEDRIVKRFFRDEERAGRASILTPRPVVPSTGEVRRNPRARSAKLRVMRRIAGEEGAQ